MPDDQSSARRIAVWSGHDVIPSVTGLTVKRRSDGRVLARYVGRQYRVIEEHNGPTIYTLLATANIGED